MEEATEQLQEWKDKLESFNTKVPTPESRPVEIVQEDNSTIPHIDLVGQKKTEDKEIVVDNTDRFADSDEHLFDTIEKLKTIEDGFDPDEVMFDMVEEPEVDKDKQLEEFKKREQEELAALQEYARKAMEENATTVTVEEALKMSEAESVETPIQEERIKPDLTEVIEPEAEIEKPEDVIKNSKPRVMRTIRPTEDRPPKPILSNWQRAELLDNFHKEHGNFEDVQDYVQNEEQGDTTTWKKIKNKTTTEEDYHLRMEQRIEDLMAKVEAGETKLEDLTAEDRQVIMDIRNQNEV